MMNMKRKLENYCARSIWFSGAAMVLGVTFDEVDLPEWIFWLVLGWVIARVMVDVVPTADRYISKCGNSGKGRHYVSLAQYELRTFSLPLCDHV